MSTRPTPWRAADLVERRQQLGRGSSFPFDLDRDASVEADRHVLGLVRRRPRVDGQLEHRRPRARTPGPRAAPPRARCARGSGRGSRALLASTRHRDLALVGVVDRLLAPGDRPLAPRRDDLSSGASDW